MNIIDDLLKLVAFLLHNHYAMPLLEAMLMYMGDVQVRIQFVVCCRSSWA